MFNRVGQQIGNYHLVRLLGAGDFADVYLGKHLDLGVQAAIKIFHTRLTQDDTDKFRTQVLAIARLRHPHIISILDFGIDSEDNTPYLIMEYASGGSLRMRHPKGSQVPLPTIIRYLKELASALQYAHHKDILHRNIKPDNMLIGQHGELLLSDFGIALLSQTGRTSLQDSTNVGGMPHYMAPEQFFRKSKKASDQYALAAVVYEWLSGTVPFNWTELGFQHLLPLRRSVPTLPTSVEQAVMKALTKRPQDRFPSIEAFIQALQTSSTPTHVFISYARRDQNLRDQLENHQGNALVGLERYSEALTAFEQAVVLTPLPAIYVNMGDVLATLGRYDEAVAAYQQALAMDTSYASAYAGMSKALSQLGRIQEAEQAYQQAKELGDED